MQKLKELIKLSNLCNFQLFASNIEGNIGHQKLRNCCVAKKLMGHKFSVKYRVLEEDFSETIRCTYWAQIFRDNWNCYALSIFIVFTLLASSDSDKHMLMRQKVYTKIRLYWTSERLENVWVKLSTSKIKRKRISRDETYRFWLGKYLNRQKSSNSQAVQGKFVVFSLSNHCIKWIDSMLWCVCSVLDLRRLHNEVTNSVRHLPIICFWTGAWQHGIN